MAEIIWKLLWISLLVLNYAVHADAGSIHRHGCAKSVHPVGAKRQFGLLDRRFRPSSGSQGRPSFQVVSAQPVQSVASPRFVSQDVGFGFDPSEMGSSSSRVYPYVSRWMYSNPAENGYEQTPSRPLESYYQYSHYFQDGLGSSVTGTGSSDSMPYSSQESSYSSSYEPSTVTFKPAQNAFQKVPPAQLIQTKPASENIPSDPALTGAYDFAGAIQGLSYALPERFSQLFPSNFQQVALDQQSGYPSDWSSYTSSFSPASIFKPAQSTYQQVGSSQPEMSVTGLGSVSQQSYTSGFKPLSSVAKPAHTDLASAPPIQTTSGLPFQNYGFGSNVNGAVSALYGIQDSPYTSSFRLPTGATTQPVQSPARQVATAQQSGYPYSYTTSIGPPSISKSVQSTYEQVASFPPMQTTSPFGLYSLNVDFGSSERGTDSRAYGAQDSYTSFGSPTGVSQPGQYMRQGVFSAQPVQSAYQQVSSAQAFPNEYQSDLYSQNLDFGSSATGANQIPSGEQGSRITFYTSKYPPANVLLNLQGASQQVTQPAQSRANWAFDSLLSGMAGSSSVSLPGSSGSLLSQGGSSSDSTLLTGLAQVPGQVYSSPYVHVQSARSQDGSELSSVGKRTSTWAQKTPL
ncbi:uncharacterized protein [Hoplias malabaricus]|uniref:uncharacterized protein n=1 Tax=Hoplias malabaricus TaxID=27720 RepID=UPI0034629B04